MAITRLGGANAISGTIPQGNIANASLGAVTALPSGMVSAPGLTTGKIVKVSFANPSNYSTTLNYNSTSLTPCAQITHTAAATNSHFLIKWSAVHGRNGNGRSQFLLAKAYTAGNNNYADSNYLFYDHYGLYHDNATNLKHTTSYSYYDNGSSLAAGASQTYYVFLGGIGSGFTDEANNQRMQVLEIAQ